MGPFRTATISAETVQPVNSTDAGNASELEVVSIEKVANSGPSKSSIKSTSDGDSTEVLEGARLGRHIAVVLELPESSDAR